MSATLEHPAPPPAPRPGRADAAALPPVGFGPGQRRPTFVVLGAAKAGTTDLCHRLSLHPDVFMAPGKEMNFFSHPRNWQRGLNWYASRFRAATTEHAVGEGSPPYTYCHVHEQAADRIAEHLPEARLIYMVRHPMTRVASHWMQLVSNGKFASRPVGEAVREVREVWDASLYQTQLGQYRQRFDASQILTLFFDDWVKDRGPGLAACFEHLGVDPHAPLNEGRAEVVNSTRQSFEDRPLTRVLRHVPGLESVGRRLPMAVQRNLTMPLLRRPVTLDHLRFDRESWEWVRQRVEPDATAFLESVGRPADYWSYEFPEGGRLRKGAGGHL